MFYVYILQSQKTSRFYCGSCQDVTGRLHRHNTAQVTSTKHGIPWKLIYTESFPTRSQAYRKEMKIKKQGIKRYLQDIGQLPG